MIENIFDDEVLMADKKSEFINKTYSNQTKKSINTHINFWKKISRIELLVGNGKEITKYTKEEYIEFFNLFDIGSEKTYDSTKARIKKYLKFCEVSKKQIHTLSSIRFDDLDLNKMYDEMYFNSFQDLKNKVQKHLSMCDNIVNQHSTAITAIYLLWYGISVDQMIEIQKTDIYDNGICVDNEFIQLDIECYDYILEYADDGSNLANDMLSSKYLLRSNIKEKLNYSSLKSAITRFNNGNKNSHVIFKPEKIFESGIYWRTYQYELLNGCIPKTNSDLWTKILRHSSGKRHVSRTRNSYYRYVNHVYGDLYDYKYGE